MRMNWKGGKRAAELLCSAVRIRSGDNGNMPKGQTRGVVSKFMLSKAIVTSRRVADEERGSDPRLTRAFANHAAWLSLLLRRTGPR